MPRPTTGWGWTQTTDTLAVSEVYPAWQGEGPSAGRVCSFIRLRGCNLTCGWHRRKDGLARVEGAWACDEPQTWHHDHMTTAQRMTAEQITAQATAHDEPMTVITGGEPLLHQEQPAWPILLQRLRTRTTRIEIETNGTIAPNRSTIRFTDQFNVSPKLASSGLAEADRYNPVSLGVLLATRRAVFKFVATSPADVHEAAAFANHTGIPAPLVWIMPEGSELDGATHHLATARAIAGTVTSYQFNLTLRQHVLLYDGHKEPR